MSLVGNLEDLGLGEILQIVSLSRKSGVLSLFSRGRKGKIVFRQGQVILATINGQQSHLGQLLLKNGVITNATLRKALMLQEQEGVRERLGALLSQRFSVPVDLIEEVVRQQIENTVYALFAWSEGSFDFELRDNVDGIEDHPQDLSQCFMEQGLNPQFLAMEGSRILDERRHRGELPPEGEYRPEVEEGSFLDSCDLAFDLIQDKAVAGDASATKQGEERIIVLVDDDELVRERLSLLLTDCGFTVHDFSKTEDTLIKIDFLYRDGFRPTVLVDLIMPRMDGSGILGGLELIDLIHDNFPDLAVIVLADHHNSNAEQKVREKGYPFLLKPRRSDILDVETFRVFSEHLKSELVDGYPENSPAAANQTINLRDELFQEIGEEFMPISVPAPHGPEVSLLRSMLGELNNPSLDGGILLLVLRFAAEFMNRAVVFTVREDGIRGLGQFGIVVPDGLADAHVRDLHIPLDSDPFFTRAITSRITIKESPELTEWSRYLFAQLGGGAPQEIFLGPLVSEGKVVALLYGDNLPDNKPIVDTDSLEIFLAQAGMAMEKALLQKRLKEKDQEEM
ncbi:MAG: response regulator [Deltaproteobacteria bacterium]|nr:response regulator [Deltaproteobacteria bacterium]